MHAITSPSHFLIPARLLHLLPCLNKQPASSLIFGPLFLTFGLFCLVWASFYIWLLSPSSPIELRASGMTRVPPRRFTLFQGIGRLAGLLINFSQFHWVSTPHYPGCAAPWHWVPGFFFSGWSAYKYPARQYQNRRQWSERSCWFLLFVKLLCGIFSKFSLVFLGVCSRW